MGRHVRILGIGVVVDRYCRGEGPADCSEKVADVVAVLAHRGKRIRLIHRIEEMALLSAWEALAESGIGLPLQNGERVGIALGVEEGIDAIKARHCLALQSEGLLGVSPIMFPLTAPNTVTAQVSIALDIRGETFTLCGGQLSGAAAVGLALDVVRQGRAHFMLAGGATSVDRVFLDGLSVAGVQDDGAERDGACMLVLAPAEDGSGKGDERTPLLLGYGEGFGIDGVREAVNSCLEDANLFPREVGSVWEASPGPMVAAQYFSKSEVSPTRILSPSADLFSASFPLTVAAAVKEQAGGIGGPALIVGSDCLGGAAAALVRGVT